MSLLETVLASLAQGGGAARPAPARAAAGGDLQALLLQVVAAMLAGGGAAGAPGAARAAPPAGGGLGAVLGSVLGGGGAAGGLGGMAGAGGGGTGGLGGLGELMQQFQRAGLGDVMNSWIGPGQNAPISPNQLGRALGDDFVGGLTRQLGVPQDQLLAQLSQLLPQVVDRATPEGRVPEGGLGDIGAILSRFGPR